MMFHTVHAWDEGDDVVIDLCAYADRTIMRTIEDVMVGSEPHAARAYVDRVRLGPSGRVDRARRSSCPIEFPRVAPSALGGPYRMVYGVAWPEGRPFLAQPAAIDTATGEASLAALGPQEFAGECVPVSKARASSESDVWLLTLVLDGASRSTELRVLDGADIGAPPGQGAPSARRSVRLSRELGSGRARLRIDGSRRFLVAQLKSNSASAAFRQFSRVTSAFSPKVSLKSSTWSLQAPFNFNISTDTFSYHSSVNR